MAETTVIIDFSGKTSPLEPHWPATHRAMLPVCGKALIIHLVESLAPRRAEAHPHG